MLHVENLEEDMLSKMTSRSAATMHDEQDHLIQRRCAREAIGSSPIIQQWDEGSKRCVMGSKPRAQRPTHGVSHAQCIPHTAHTSRALPMRGASHDLP
jgi:hypothetical protein